MKRITQRGILIVGLVVSAGFAAWSWMRPYEWSADETARCRVIGCQVKQDRSNYWVDVHLKVNAGQTHDLMKPVALVTQASREIESADTTLSGDEKDDSKQEVWLKFWLEKEDFSGPLVLKINDGKLGIRTHSGLPSLGSSGLRYFVTNHW